MKRHHSLDYFLALETDLRALSRYVEFSSDNFAVYSLELTRLLLAAGSEVDIACKELCALIEPSSKTRNINEYRSVILPRFPEVQTQQVRSRRFRIVFSPWEGWAIESPKWWTAYNNVKHDRLVNHKEANLGHVLNAVAGLGVIMQYFGDLVPENFTGQVFDHHLRIQLFDPSIDRNPKA